MAPLKAAEPIISWQLRQSPGPGWGDTLTKPQMDRTSVVPGKASASEPQKNHTGPAPLTQPLSEFYFLVEETEAWKEVPWPKPEAGGLGLDWPQNDCGGLFPRGHSHVVSADGAHAAMSGNAAPPKKVCACAERTP